MARKETIMKKLLVFSAAAVTLAFAVAGEASAQRGFRGGAGIGGGAIRSAAIASPGIRSVGAASIGRPGLGVIGRPGLGVVGRPGLGVVGRPGVGVVGRPWVGRPGWGVAGWRWRRWGFPVAAGVAALGAGYYGGYGYYDDCLVWNGYGWVNVCYQPNYNPYW
jgi:hypothetical protein